MISEEQLFLVPKKIIKDALRFRIPTGLSGKGIISEGYCTWEELINTKGPLPTDVVAGMSWDDEEDSEDSGISLDVVVVRERLETDEEYLKRLDEEEEEKKIHEKNEFKIYNRLKQKYETKL
jgi:hypothetical protein